ncbi:MAG: CRTAC1 family protein [Gammaproteobacteria bacterium]|jgi:hypothetical protein|nr:CRTAC1 family protein [Gammaproteobacteria bacterium]
MSKIIQVFFYITILGATSCSKKQSIQFEDISFDAGVADVAVNSSGPSFIDYDNDGDIDIYVNTEYHGENQGNRLFENDGSGYFIDVAVERGVDNKYALGRGASWGDYDNDGDMDLIVSNLPSSGGTKIPPTTLFKNLLIETGSANFRNATIESNLFRANVKEDREIGGIGNTGAGVAWADYDNDGDLDLYWKCADYDIDNALFRNNGDGTFTDVTEEAGAGIIDLVAEAGSQGSPNWTDVNQDGWIDLLVTNEGSEKILFLNQENGTFKNITRSFRAPSGTVFLNPGNANGACIGDIDNDGDMDVFLPTADQSNRLYISLLSDTGSLSYKDISLSSGIDHKSGARGCTMGDFDNDGLIDIYVNNGGLQNTLINDVINLPIFVQFYIAIEPAYNKLFQNNGDLTFSDVTKTSGTEVLGIGSGVGNADLDDDGFLDLFLTNRTFYNSDKQITESDRNYLLRNKGNGNNWIKIELTGTKSNTNAYGARVKVMAGESIQYREHTSAHGYNSANDYRLHFGLANEESIDSIEIIWPSGERQLLTDVAVNQTLSIEE